MERPYHSIKRGPQHGTIEHKQGFVGAGATDRATLVNAGLTYVRTGALPEILTGERTEGEDSPVLDKNGLPADTDLEELRKRGVGITRNDPTQISTSGTVIEMHMVAADYGSGPLGYRSALIRLGHDGSALLTAREGWDNAGRFPGLEVTLIEAY